MEEELRGRGRSKSKTRAPSRAPSKEPRGTKRRESRPPPVSGVTHSRAAMGVSESSHARGTDRPRSLDRRQQERRQSVERNSTRRKTKATDPTDPFPGARRPWPLPNAMHKEVYYKEADLPDQSCRCCFSLHHSSGQCPWLVKYHQDRLARAVTDPRSVIPTTSCV